MMRKHSCLGILAGASLAAVSVFADGETGVKVAETFATAGDLATVKASESGTRAYENWTGTGTVGAADVDHPKPENLAVGLPVANDDNKNVLSVEGWVQLTQETTANKPALVEMMVQVVRPEDDLAIPSSENEEQNPIQIALGVEKNGELKVYCKNKEDAKDWYGLGVTPDENSWVRVSFQFDYSKKLCQIRVNGEPVMSAVGYVTVDGDLSAVAPQGEVIKGSWYKLITTDTKINSLKVIGSTKIDDVLVKDADAADSVLPVIPETADTQVAVGNGKDAVTITRSWIEKQGITTDQARGNALDGSGMTVAQKYITGLSVADGQTFEMKSMSMQDVEEDSVKKTKVTVGIPRMNPPAGHSVKLQYSTESDFPTDDSKTSETAITANATEVTVEVPSDKNVIYYRLRAE